MTGGRNQRNDSFGYILSGLVFKVSHLFVCPLLLPFPPLIFPSMLLLLSVHRLNFVFVSLSFATFLPFLSPRRQDLATRRQRRPLFLPTWFFTLIHYMVVKQQVTSTDESSQSKLSCSPSFHSSRSFMSVRRFPPRRRSWTCVCSSVSLAHSLTHPLSVFPKKIK